MQHGTYLKTGLILFLDLTTHSVNIRFVAKHTCFQAESKPCAMPVTGNKHANSDNKQITFFIIIYKIELWEQRYGFPSVVQILVQLTLLFLFFFSLYSKINIDISSKSIHFFRLVAYECFLYHVLFFKQ